MLDRDVVVLELARLLLGARQDPAQALGGVDLTGVGATAGNSRDLRQFVGELAPHDGAIDAAELEHRGDQALVVFEQRGEQMLDVNRLVVRIQRGILRAPQRLLELFSETGWTTHRRLPFRFPYSN